jgi:hypothetical protein
MTVPVEANLFHLQGGGLHITWASTSFSGKPLFTYQDAHGEQHFSGDQIHIAASPIGSLVTVSLHKSTSFSVLIPTVSLTATGQSALVHTEGITTVHRHAAPMRLGQTESYAFTALHGTATQVIS